MSPANAQLTRPLDGQQRQRGFAAVAAIFLVVVLAALGGFMLTFSNTQQLTSVQDLQGTRAYWAAQAGLEWGIANAANCATFPPGSVATLPGASNTFDGGFTVSVDCSLKSFTEAAASANVNIYSLNAVARSGGGVGTIGYVERSLSVVIEK